MVRAPPSEVLIVSEIFRCQECKRGTEKFLYHAENDDYRYYDPASEDRDRGVERLVEDVTVECSSCGSEDVVPENYEGDEL